jgi:tetratricopeptide (TPR) repeat protein
VAERSEEAEEAAAESVAGNSPAAVALALGRTSRAGDPDRAIAKFELARRKGPRFADPLKLWGEALMLSGRYAEARAQYEIARGLDLSRPDRAALDVLLARTAKGVLHG